MSTAGQAHLERVCRSHVRPPTGSQARLSASTAPGNTSHAAQEQVFFLFKKKSSALLLTFYLKRFETHKHLQKSREFRVHAS